MVFIIYKKAYPETQCNRGSLLERIDCRTIKLKKTSSSLIDKADFGWYGMLITDVS
jgi:hypothetical protein